MKISDLSVKKPVTTVVFYLGIIVLGVFSLGKLAIDLIPDISSPYLNISHAVDLFKAGLYFMLCKVTQALEVSFALNGKH
ncbi:MAG TPA: efflux RND transporter permease subunit, partial [Spirochaetales bacterium]|nr:efflux RND transporter permease subunit [Spirochaetales bacterium]